MENYLIQQHLNKHTDKFIKINSKSQQHNELIKYEIIKTFYCIKLEC